MTYQAVVESAEDLRIKRLLDEYYMIDPCLEKRRLADSGRRFPTFWGPGHDWVPDFNWGGSGAIGFQEMLMQTPGKRIILLPAWPKDWNIDFKLHAPYKTTVEGKVRDGKVIDLIVTPEARKKDVIFLKS